MLSAIALLLHCQLAAEIGSRIPAERDGKTSRGIGTLRACQEGEMSGVFSGLAKGLNTLVSALLIPPLPGAPGLVA